MTKVLGKNYHSNQITAIGNSTLTSSEIELFKHKLEKAKSKILKNLNIAFCFFQFMLKKFYFTTC